MKLSEYFSTSSDTPELLAARIGRHVSTVYRIMTGVRNPGPKLIPVIHRETNGLVTANDFFDLAPLPEKKRKR